jgi:hypothetical protein
MLLVVHPFGDARDEDTGMSSTTPLAYSESPNSGLGLRITEYMIQYSVYTFEIH